MWPSLSQTKPEPVPSIFALSSTLDSSEEVLGSSMSSIYTTDAEVFCQKKKRFLIYTQKKRSLKILMVQKPGRDWHFSLLLPRPLLLLFLSFVLVRSQIQLGTSVDWRSQAESRRAPDSNHRRSRFFFSDQGSNRSKLTLTSTYWMELLKYIRLRNKL